MNNVDSRAKSKDTRRRGRFEPSYETRYRLAKAYGYPMPRRPDPDEEQAERLEAIVERLEALLLACPCRGRQAEAL